MTDKSDVNLYLFYEFGVEGDEAQVSEQWPFELRNAGRIRAGGYESEVYEFSDGDRSYFALDLGGLNFYPSDGMTLEELQLEEEGRFWLGQREPVDLNTARIGDDSVPRTQERRAAIQELITEALGTTVDNIRILEGLFLRKGHTYLALVQKQDSGDVYVVGSNIEPHAVGLPQASDWRRLSLSIGYMLREGKLAS